MTDSFLVYAILMTLIMSFAQCLLLAMLNDKLREGLKDILKIVREK